VADSGGARKVRDVGVRDCGFSFDLARQRPQAGAEDDARARRAGPFGSDSGNGGGDLVVEGEHAGEGS